MSIARAAEVAGIPSTVRAWQISRIGGTNIDMAGTGRRCRRDRSSTTQGVLEAFLAGTFVLVAAGRAVARSRAPGPGCV